MKKLIRFFFLSSAFLLLVTAAAKLISSAGSAPILKEKEIFFKIPYRHLFWLVGGCELVVAGACILSKRTGLRAALLACLATYFLMYRISMHWVGISYCPCLGSLTEALPFSERAIELSLMSVLIYFLAGSYTILLARLWSKLQPRSPESSDSNLANLPEGIPQKNKDRNGSVPNCP